MQMHFILAGAARLLGTERLHTYALLQVDLSTQPSKREAMLAGSDNNTKLPQLHVNGQVCTSNLHVAVSCSTHALCYTVLAALV